MFKMVVELMVKQTVLHWIKWNPAPDLFFSDDGKFLKLKASPFMQDTWAANATVYAACLVRFLSIQSGHFRIVISVWHVILLLIPLPLCYFCMDRKC